MDALPSSDDSCKSDDCDASIIDNDSGSSTSGSGSSSHDNNEDDRNEDKARFDPLIDFVRNGECIDPFSSCIRKWTEEVPVGMNLCPWAKLSYLQGRIRYVTCHDRIPHEVSTVVWEEIDNLLKTPLPAWSTTLVVCPYVKSWTNDFAVFERFVKEFGKEEEPYSTTLPIGSMPSVAFRAITLVPFHPQFLRWRGLPETISVDSNIFCHKGLAGFSKSPGVYPAAVVDLMPSGFGRRRIKVRFHGDPKTNQKKRTSYEQCIPVDWVQLSQSEVDERPVLSDNAMHRTPYPVIHILRNEDLKSLTFQEVSRLKRRNAKRMASDTLI